MASITIRNLDDEVKTRLRVRATGNGRSMEEEARLILRKAVEPKTAPRNLASARRWSRRPLPGISRAPYVPGSRPSAAWTWSCRRASPRESRRPSIEFRS